MDFRDSNGSFSTNAGWTQWQIAAVAAVILITALCYLPVLSGEKEFTNWDDPDYVLNQPLIKELTVQNVKTLFRPSTAVLANYHPITMLSLALNYKWSGDKIFGYALTNLLLHLVNTLLVFFMLYRLSGRKVLAGILGSLWFGIHPMHVESVAWIAERKDVLYCFFFLLAYQFYLKYLDSGNGIFLAVAFISFVCSCLSKAMAVPFPLVLLLTDLLMARKITIKVIAEKIPFLIVSLLIGFNAYKIQAASAITEFEAFSAYDHFVFAAYGFIMYWIKFFIPFNLSVLYPYPLYNADKTLPFLYYTLPFFAALLVMVPGIVLYKNKLNTGFKLFVFGMGFFILMVALVLQFISVGMAIMADRYTYLPYIGSCLIFGVLAHEGFRQKRLAAFTATVCVVFTVFLAIKCYSRVQVWANSERIWTDMLNQYLPNLESKRNLARRGVKIALKNRGSYYFDTRQYEKAFSDFSLLVMAKTTDPGVYNNLANIYSINKQYVEAIEYFSKAIEFDTTGKLNYYMNRAFISFSLGNNDDAQKDFEKIIELCNNKIKQNHMDANVYYFRGIAYSNLSLNSEAVLDLEKSVSLKTDFPDAWFNLAVVYKNMNNFSEARRCAMKASELGYKPSAQLLKELP